MDFDYFKNNHRLTATDLSKQKALYKTQEQFNRLFLLVGQIQVQWFITFSNNQKKLYKKFSKGTTKVMWLV